MPDAIRVGLVGARFAARFHYEGYRRVYGVPVQMVGVTSKSADSRQAFARERGISAFASLDELCDAADVIDICAPASAHEPLAIAALRRGKHVVIEKPFTGYYGPGAAAGEEFRGNTFPKETMLREALASCDRILAAARITRRQRNLHVVYISNFKCGPDSYIKSFMNEAAGKPGLVLQFDGHSNDAGFITRCEAYLDSKGFLRCSPSAATTT